MASIVLGTAVSAVGASVAGPFGGQLGAQLGQLAGSALDNAILPGRKLRPLNGPRLADLGVQTSTYGKMIPLVYGTMRIAGNIIWSMPIKELATTTTSTAGGGGKGGGGKVSQSTTTYSYSVTLAVAVCEGAVDDVLRIWADAKQLDLSLLTVRIYHGSEEQLPDALIQAVEGADRTPAFRGLAYVVFEDFPLADYGNRIPNFTFEVQRKLLQADHDGQLLENIIRGVVMIPGAGEFVYDTQVVRKVPGSEVGGEWAQQGVQQALNRHTPYGTANLQVALDQLEKTCPNVQWVSLVVSWFGTSMDAGDCAVVPGVEFKAGAVVSPADWQVAGFSRASAHEIGYDDDQIRYGGTPDDGSVVRCVQELRARGYKVAFYPLMFMDVAGKPWRGHLSGAAADVAEFFTREDGYNAYVTHYAQLLEGLVDAFIIGSELKGLTAVSAAPGVYPAVEELVALAGQVKETLGEDVVVTYAADWSEYHHTDGGWYNLDALWACPDIDVIGIDAYFPLSDAPQGAYDIQAIMDGWSSGEGYDWYYADGERTVKAPLGAAYAWKNLQWFWDNVHVNPDAAPTGWLPRMKKIWFTEYGFPSVDGAANQPNVFYSASSAASAFPYYSRGRVDFVAQRTALMATELKWQGSEMVERLFVWAWDARPFPYWPDLRTVWSDGTDWKTGHWVQGKLGTSSLGAVVRDICLRSGLLAAHIDVSRLQEQLDGYVITQPQSFRNAIETLQSAYFFDVVESGGQLRFVPRGGEAAAELTSSDLLVSSEAPNPLSIVRAQEVELPRRVNVVYVSRLQNYQAAMQYAQRQVTKSRDNYTIDLPLALTEQLAKRIADISLLSAWVGRVSYSFELPVRFARLEPGDVVTLAHNGKLHRMRVSSTRYASANALRVEAVADDASCFEIFNADFDDSALTEAARELPQTASYLLDIPALPGDEAERGVLRVAAAGLSEGWRGAAFYRSDDGGENFARVADAPLAAAMGTCLEALSEGAADVFDEANSLTVALVGEAGLQGVSELAVLNGANAALVGSEIIQFREAQMLEPGKYRISGLLRGRLGTEWAMSGHVAGERFVLLDAAVLRISVPNNLLGLARDYKAVSIGGELGQAAVQNFTYSGVALKPYSPAHVSGTRDEEGNLTVSWLRRTRLGGNWQDMVDVPLNEARELYELDVMDGEEIVRSITGLTQPQATYSASQQTEDFGAVQAVVLVRVCQLSALVGRGYGAQAEV